MGDEVAWWKKVGVDPTISARALWLARPPLPMPAEEESRSSALASSAQTEHSR